jgi:mRNA guanylyltransferase
VFAVDIPALQHGNDGLIYTCVNAAYLPGKTDPNMFDRSPGLCRSFINDVFLLSRLKWKPPSENSIDFRLVLRFPPSASQPSQPDFQAKPVFLLHVWCGEMRGVPTYELYDDMYVDDAEWEKYATLLLPNYAVLIYHAESKPQVSRLTTA